MTYMQVYNACTLSGYQVCEQVKLSNQYTVNLVLKICL